MAGLRARNHQRASSQIQHHLLTTRQEVTSKTHLSTFVRRDSEGNRVQAGKAVLGELVLAASDHSFLQITHLKPRWSHKDGYIQKDDSNKHWQGCQEGLINGGC